MPLLSFLFLVALGVDYNIFLVTRAREETATLGTRAGILEALAVTGGVITSAGILLAAVFAVLGVLPVVVLTEIGVIVGVGVLLDTLLVRTVLVPALVTLIGNRFWWPGQRPAPPARPTSNRGRGTPWSRPSRSPWTRRPRLTPSNRNPSPDRPASDAYAPRPALLRNRRQLASLRTGNLPSAGSFPGDGRTDTMPDLAQQLAELKERYGAHDFVVEDIEDDDPILRSVDGTIVDTWREAYPYDQRMSNDEYEGEKRLLQIELLKMQNWIKASGSRQVILFEGRDAAGKGGTIKRFMEHLNPRYAHTVALEKPSDREKRQWYFQRYIPHLPAEGEITLFDRSWYTRAGVERVMGFCTRAEYAQFLRQAPLFEDLLVDEGFQLFKFWFSVSQGEQSTRFLIRQIDPVRQWSSPPPTSRRWTSGTCTRGPRRTCSCTPTPRRPHGR